MNFEEPDGVRIDEKTILSVTAGYVDERQSLSGLHLVRYKHNKRYGWRPDQELELSTATTSTIASFLHLLISYRKHGASNARIALDGLIEGVIDADMLSNANALAHELAQSSNLTQDVFALKHRKASLKWFETEIGSDRTEKEWQDYFERNKWIFGTGLDVRVLDPLSDKLETVALGATAFQPGKEADALLRSRAVVSQTVFVEIKRPTTALLSTREYRTGVWPLGSEVTGAVSQVQYQADRFAREWARIDHRDAGGKRTGEETHVVYPECYVVVGTLSQITEHDEQIRSFELARRNMVNPRVVTFDELLERARYLTNLAEQQI